MANPVVHFDIIGADPDALRGYYGRLFGWSFDTPAPVATELSDSASDGFLDLVTGPGGSGIRGGIGSAKVAAAAYFRDNARYFS